MLLFRGGGGGRGWGWGWGGWFKNNNMQAVHAWPFDTKRHRCAPACKHNHKKGQVRIVGSAKCGRLQTCVKTIQWVCFDTWYHNDKMASRESLRACVPVTNNNEEQQPLWIMFRQKRKPRPDTSCRLHGGHGSPSPPGVVALCVPGQVKKHPWYWQVS